MNAPQSETPFARQVVTQFVESSPGDSVMRKRNELASHGQPLRLLPLPICWRLRIRCWNKRPGSQNSSSFTACTEMIPRRSDLSSAGAADLIPGGDAAFAAHRNTCSSRRLVRDVRSRRSLPIQQPAVGLRGRRVGRIAGPRCPSFESDDHPIVWMNLAACKRRPDPETPRSILPCGMQDGLNSAAKRFRSRSAVRGRPIRRRRASNDFAPDPIVQGSWTFNVGRQYCEFGARQGLCLGRQRKQFAITIISGKRRSRESGRRSRSSPTTSCLAKTDRSRFKSRPRATRDVTRRGWFQTWTVKAFLAVAVVLVLAFGGGGWRLAVGEQAAFGADRAPLDNNLTRKEQVAGWRR